MNAVTTFFKVFGILVALPVIVLFWPPVIVAYLIYKNIIESDSIMVILGSLMFFAILNAAWIFFLLQTAVNFGWISG